jgi:hypothetical protein
MFQGSTVLSFAPVLALFKTQDKNWREKGWNSVCACWENPKSQKMREQVKTCSINPFCGTPAWHEAWLTLVVQQVGVCQCPPPFPVSRQSIISVSSLRPQAPSLHKWVQPSMFSQWLSKERPLPIVPLGSVHQYSYCSNIQLYINSIPSAAMADGDQWMGSQPCSH